MADMMTFPDTAEEFMEKYKIVDTEQVYTNGSELVPIFRMKQWFEHLPSAQPERRPYHEEWVSALQTLPEIIRCKDCKHWDGVDTCDVIDAPVWDNDFCSLAERRSHE